MVLASAIGSTSCGGSPSNVDGGRDAGPPLPGTYENVVQILSTSCAFTSCHGGAGPGAGRLNLARSIADGSLREDLVDRPSCQYSAMPLVLPGAPERSWLYLKVAGPHSGQRLEFTPEPSWDPGIMPDATGSYPPSMCPLVEGGSIAFGAMMPIGTTGLDASRAETIRAWIVAGAPGPS